MELQATKIPRLRESRYAKNNTTYIEFKPSCVNVENEQSKVNTTSLAKIASLEPLTPEQLTIKYKNYPHKFCKKSCIICGMGKPQTRLKTIKIEQPKVESSSKCTQTIPPSPLPERWNAQTQTTSLKTRNTSLIEIQHQKEYGRLSFSILSFGAWLSLFMVIFAVAVLLSVRNLDILKWVTRKQLRRPGTFLENVLSYFYRDQILGNAANRSRAHDNKPIGMVTLFFLSLLFICGINYTEMTNGFS